MAKFKNPTKVITGKDTRFSYLVVNEPKAINGGTPKYSVSLIIPKSDTVTVEKVKAAIQAAYDEGQSKLKGNGKSVPALSVLKTPLRDAVVVGVVSTDQCTTLEAGTAGRYCYHTPPCFGGND